MIEKLKAAGLMIRGLFEFCLITGALLAILAAVLSASAWILNVGVEDYGLLGGVLIAVPFLVVVWGLGLYVAGTVRRAIWP